MRVDPGTCRDPELLAAEVRRLQAVIAASEPEIAELEQAIRRLAEQDATLSVCDGNVTVEMDGITLTDAEREAVRFCAVVLDMGSRPDCAATLRGLLDRTK